MGCLGMRQEEFGIGEKPERQILGNLTCSNCGDDADPVDEITELCEVCTRSLNQISHRSTIDIRPKIMGDLSGPLVVTFQSAAMGGALGGDNGLDKMGFGETFLEKMKINAVHVLASRNHWYQTDDIEGVVDEIYREYASKASHVVAYGSSMGAYGALMYAARIGASSVVALSPQFSINPAKAPFEPRFTRFFDPGDWTRDTYSSAGFDRIQAVLIYDPYDADGQHALLIKEVIPSIELVPTRFAGHPVGPVLKQTELLKPMIADMAAGRFDVDGFRKDFAMRRHGSNTYLQNIYTFTRRTKNTLRRYIAGYYCFGAGAMRDKVKVDFAMRCREVGNEELARQVLANINVANLKDDKAVAIFEREKQRMGLTA